MFCYAPPKLAYVLKGGAITCVVCCIYPCMTEIRCYFVYRGVKPRVRVHPQWRRSFRVDRIERGGGRFRYISCGAPEASCTLIRVSMVRIVGGSSRIDCARAQTSRRAPDNFRSKTSTFREHIIISVAEQPYHTHHSQIILVFPIDFSF